MTAVTTNVPLYAEFPTPLVLVELLTFNMLTLSLTFKSCGKSVLTVTVLEDAEHVLINLGLRSKNTSLASIVLIEKSVLARTPVLLDSCITNPSSGSFAFDASFGTTTRTVYNLSSNDLGSTTLEIVVTLLFSVSPVIPDDASSV